MAADTMKRPNFLLDSDQKVGYWLTSMVHNSDNGSILKPLQKEDQFSPYNGIRWAVLSDPIIK